MIDVGGPAMVRAAAKNFAHVGVVVDPADYAAVIAELRAGAAACRRADAAAPGRQGLPPHGRLRRAPSCLLARRRAQAAAAWDPFPERLATRVDQVPGAALRREPPPARRLLPRRRRAGGLGRPRAPAPGQGAVVQQHPRLRRRARPGPASSPTAPASIVKHGNPCGVALGDGPARRLPAGARNATRSAPSAASSPSIARSTARRRGDRRAVLRGVIAPGFDAEARRAAGAEEEPAAARAGEPRRARPLPGSTCAASAGGLLVQDWDASPRTSPTAAS